MTVQSLNRLFLVILLTFFVTWFRLEFKNGINESGLLVVRGPDVPHGPVFVDVRVGRRQKDWSVIVDRVLQLFWFISTKLNLVQWKPLNGITLGQRQLDFNDCLIIISNWASVCIRCETIIWDMSARINFLRLTNWRHYLWFH
jgi:hypothetical protein